MKMLIENLEIRSLIYIILTVPIFLYFMYQLVIVEMIENKRVEEEKEVDSFKSRDWQVNRYRAKHIKEKHLIEEKKGKK